MEIDLSLDAMMESNTDTKEYNSGTPVPPTVENLEGKLPNLHVPVPSTTEITADAYNDAIGRLKASFKECMDIIGDLEHVKIVEEKAEDNIDKYDQIAFDSMFESALNGAIYEAVERKDKDDIKKIIKDIKPDFKKEMTENHIMFNEQKYILGRILMLFGNAAAGISLTAIGPNLPTKLFGITIFKLDLKMISKLIQLVWYNHAWQIVGTISAHGETRDELLKKFNEDHKEELGDYKLIAVDFSDTGYGSLIIVDKKLSSEIKTMVKDIDTSIDLAEKAKEKAKSKKEKKSEEKKSEKK